MGWLNEAMMGYGTNPTRFTNLTTIGMATGVHLRNFSNWTQRFLDEHPTFNPVGVFYDSEVAISSRMCFDFVNLAMQRLHEMGAVFVEYDVVEGAPPIARDYLYVFASKLRQRMTLPTMMERRRLLRFFRAERLIDQRLEESFVFAQPFLQLMVALQITPFFYHDTTYTRVQVHQPYMNYCFSGFHLPPHDVK